MSEELQNRIQDDVKGAMRSGDKELVQTLRLLRSEIKNRSIETRRDLNDNEIVTLVQKAIKQRGESAKLYDEGQRPELADKERREAELLRAYLPPQMDDDEVRRLISELVVEQGLEGPAAIGTIMKTLMPKLGGSVDGGTLNRLARTVLAGESP